MDAKFWLDLIQFVLTGAIGVYLYLERRGDKRSSRINEVKTNAAERIKSLELKLSEETKKNYDKLADMDSRLKQAIGHPDLEPLHKRMNSMDKNLSEMNGKMHTLDLIHEWLINGGSKS